jgi:hypothetical protein
MDIDLKQHSNGNISNIKTSPVIMSPAKRPNETGIQSESKRVKPSHILHISNFKRPLLVSSVEELLTTYGEYSFFWMDKVNFFNGLDQVALFRRL